MKRMKIRDIDVAKINPAPYNPRVDLKPDDPRFLKLVGSLETFGLVEPLVWNRRTGHLVGGHQRLKVLVARGDTTATCVVVDLPRDRRRRLTSP